MSHGFLREYSICHLGGTPTKLVLPQNLKENAKNLRRIED